jgi:hypothetical protein
MPSFLRLARVKFTSLRYDRVLAAPGESGVLAFPGVASEHRRSQFVLSLSVKTKNAKSLKKDVLPVSAKLTPDGASTAPNVRDKIARWYGVA